MTSFLKDMFDVIQVLPLDDPRRQRLSVARDQLGATLLALYTLPSYENMIALNGAWAQAHYVHSQCQPGEPSPPRAGAGEKSAYDPTVSLTPISEKVA